MDQETKDAGTPAEDLATDVAHLYALAQVEDLRYRAFSRPRRSAAHPARLSEAGAKESTAERLEPVAQAGTESAGSATVVRPAAGGIAIPPGDVVEAAAPLVEQTPRPKQIEGGQTEAENCSANSGPSTSVAVLSIAGGVGKTTIVANLGRLLCFLGESVLLVDASGSGLLPFYFGANDLRPGLRTFWPPDAGSLPIHVIGSAGVTREWLEADVKAAMRGVQRTIFDLGLVSADILPQVLAMCAAVVAPVLSDLNSILTVARLETIIANIRAKEKSVPLPFYVSNKFNEQSPTEQQGRELIARQVGERLLPITIRRSPAVAKAIAERMTVADHAPQSDIAQDFLKLAQWLRKAAPIPLPVRAAGRWSER